MLCDSSKRKSIRGIYNRHLFRFQELTNTLTAISPKQSLAYCLPETTYGQEQTPSNESIICYRVKILIIQLLDEIMESNIYFFTVKIIEV
jgi:hypothetical protein